jgi:ADP-ribosylglycohydrolase
MVQKIKQAVMASFVADALALGVHWVYRVSDIDEKYGRLESMVAPEIGRWHRGKEKGAFTHYGDQSLVLLKSLARAKKFDLNIFAVNWQDFFQNYSGYLDHATKETLINFSANRSPDKAGSLSSDLGGASRMVPLAAFYHDKPDMFIAACRDQTRMTHNHPHVLASAELFARAFLKILAGSKPSEGIRTAADDMAADPQIKQAVKNGLASKTQDTRKAIAGFGQECSVEAALPSTIHLIAKYENNLEEALVENIMAGGDSSARGMFLGFLLGAYNEPDAIPGEWLKDMIHFQEISELLG